MQFSFNHFNFNVFDLEKSLKFYKENLGLEEVRRSEPDHGKFIIVYLGDGETDFKLELTWLRDWDKPYDLGDEEYHLAFVVEDYDAAYELHKKNDVICYENDTMGIYFIADPDGYWLEVMPKRR